MFNGLLYPIPFEKSMKIKRAITLSSISSFIVINLFLYEPFTLYQGNINEFNVSFPTILSSFLFPGLILVVILSAIGFLLSKELYRRYVSILCVIGFLVFLQGNVIVWKYGVLDGQGIDWSKNTWRGWVDGTLWAVFFIMAYVFNKQISKIAALACASMLLLQIALLGFMSIQNPVVWEGREKEMESISPPKEIFELSSRQNIIHVLLDGFQSDIFKEIISEDPDYYYAELEGFTFFEETTGSFPFTRFSLPAYLSGQVYKNNMPKQDFISATLKGRTIPNVLYDRGYDVDNVSFIEYVKKPYSNYYNIPTPYGIKKQQYQKSQAALMIDLVLFRSVPHIIKKVIYNNQSWLIQRFFSIENQANTLYFSHRDFLQDLIDNTTIKRQKPLYKYIHLLNAHGPPTVNKDCKYAGKVLPWTRENVRNISRCSLDHVIVFLNKLKSLGIYESSFIIISADHGRGIDVKLRNIERPLNGYSNLPRIVGFAMPLMLVKLPNSKKPLQISKAQVELTDLPATINSILNLNEEFNGRSFYSIDPNEIRKRNFFYYESGRQNYQSSFLTHLDEFIIEGSVIDRMSWHLSSIYHSPKKSYKTQKIDFGTNEAHPFLLRGWSHNIKSKKGYTYNWALGSSSSIYLSLPKNEAVIMTANIRSHQFPKPQNIRIKLDEKEIGHWKLHPPWILAKHSVVIKPDENRADVSVLEFVFSQHLSPEQHRLAVMFESITLANTH